MLKKINARPIPRSQPLGSYDPNDVVFLLKDISHLMGETALSERERVMQSGGHYSEMLPVEYSPSAAYLELFRYTLKLTAAKVALAAGTVAELIWQKRGEKVVLVSLARAGTPVGILIKRYLAQIYLRDIPHYSVSIIRDKGIDENAILYILQNHPQAAIQFIDGWTGKGTITSVLAGACREFKLKYGFALDPDLAVLADPGYCVTTYGTREDFLIPSACLNSTVSGLVSRTVHRPELIGSLDFHGAKFYRELAGEDVSNEYIDTVSDRFDDIAVEAKQQSNDLRENAAKASWQGLATVRRIQDAFALKDLNLIKPGVGETTRVLLRRLPWKILINSKNNPNLRHIFLLAQDRGVGIEEFPGLTYSCCGIIRPL